MFRESKKSINPERLVFLISDDIKEDNLRRCPTSERVKQDPLGMKLVVKNKGSIIWENQARANELTRFAGTPTFL